MYGSILEISWQIFLAGFSLYAVVKLIHFCINIGDSKDNDCNDSGACSNYDDESFQSDESDAEDENLFLDVTVNYVDLAYQRMALDEELKRSVEFYETMDKRRSVTSFSSEEVSLDVIKNVIKTAGTAPSIGHTEPWKYIVIKSAKIKEIIRKIIEETNAGIRGFSLKEHVTDAPYLILVSVKKSYGIDNKNNCPFGYSTPLSVGMLLAALQYVGLVSLVTNLTIHAEKVTKLLKRPKEERIVLMLSIGYPKVDCKVPDLQRKSLNDLLEIL